MGGLVVPQPGSAHFLQGGLAAQDGAGQRGALKDRRRQPLGAQILGVVLVHADLLQDDAPLGGNVGLVEPGGEEHVAQDIGGLGEVGIQHPGVKAGALFGGKGVDLSAHRVHFPGQLLGGAVLGALEQHMLNKMGGAIGAASLVTGAGAHPDAQSGRAHIGHPLGQDAHPVGKGDRFVHEKTSCN